MVRFAKYIHLPEAGKLTKEHYILSCEAQGVEPDPLQMPLDLEDFPDIVYKALTCFNNLRDCYIPSEMPQYSGKDITGLPVIFEIYDITDPKEKQLILKIINIFDKAQVKDSIRKIERAYKKANSK